MADENPFSVEILNITDNEDGSADIEFLLGPEALKKFAAIGIIATLKDSIDEQLLHVSDGEV
jgi:hypothetical protein